MKKGMFIWVLLVSFLSVSFAGAFAKSKQTPGTTPSGTTKKLYDRIGGKKVIKAVVDEFIANIKTDKRVGNYFTKTDFAKFKTSLVNQFCQAAGGPCNYMGKSMKEAHEGMGITGKDYDAVWEDLTKALDKAKVRTDDKQEFLGSLETYKSEIVNGTKSKKEEKKSKKSGY